MANFHLDRKSLLILGLGALVVALLVFLAGYLVGLNSALADPAEPLEPSPAAAAQPEPAPADEAPEIPVRPPEPMDPAEQEPEPEPFSDEPVPLDDSETPPPEPEEMAEEPVPEPDAGDFTIQLGAFREEEHAQSLARDLIDLGLEPEVLHLDDPVMGDLYKVRVGRYATFDEARDVARQIQAEAGRDAWAVRVGE